MATTYRVVHWQFDAVRFGKHVSAWIDVVGAEAIADVVGVAPATIKIWGKGDVPGDFNHPRMSNFIKLCDELSLNPMDFFTTSE